MTSHTRTGVVAILICLSIACGSKTTPSDPANRFTWTVDGQTFQASSNGMIATKRPDGYIDMSGAICSASNYSLVNISLPGASTAGTVPSGMVTALYFRDQQWDYRPAQGATPARGSASVVLTSASPRIIGTFTFEMVPLTGTGGNKSIQGSFDLGFGGSKICPDL